MASGPSSVYYYLGPDGFYYPASASQSYPSRGQAFYSNPSRDNRSNPISGGLAAAMIGIVLIVVLVGGLAFFVFGRGAILPPSPPPAPPPRPLDAVMVQVAGDPQLNFLRGTVTIPIQISNPNPVSITVSGPFTISLAEPALCSGTLGNLTIAATGSVQTNASCNFSLTLALASSLAQSILTGTITARIQGSLTETTSASGFTSVTARYDVSRPVAPPIINTIRQAICTAFAGATGIPTLLTLCGLL